MLNCQSHAKISEPESDAGQAHVEAKGPNPQKQDQSKISAAAQVPIVPWCRERSAAWFVPPVDRAEPISLPMRKLSDLTTPLEVVRLISRIAACRAGKAVVRHAGNRCSSSSMRLSLSPEQPAAAQSKAMAQGNIARSAGTGNAHDIARLRPQNHASAIALSVARRCSIETAPLAQLVRGRRAHNRHFGERILSNPQINTTKNAEGG